MAIIKACNVSTNIKNTGVECNKIMKAIAMLWACPITFGLTQEDLDDIVTAFKTKMHAPKGERIYPLFGRKAPIRYITNDKEADVIVTHDDGARQLVRYGFWNRMLATTSGGLCYAAALQSLNECGYGTLEIDKDGKMLAMKSTDDAFLYEAMITDFMFSPSPDAPDHKSVWKTHFQVSHDPQTLVSQGAILEDADGSISALLSLTGLLDAYIVDAGGSDTTHLKINAFSECANDDLGVALGTGFTGDVSNFIIRSSLGVEVVPTSVSYTGGKIVLVGTFPADTYTVSVRNPSVLFDNDIEGYDFGEDEADAIEITVVEV